MTHLWQDLRYGIRMLINKPAFTLAAVLVLALGIGANAAVFSLVNALLLKPLRIDKPEQIVGVYNRVTKKPDSYRAFSYPKYVDLRDSVPDQGFYDLHHMRLDYGGLVYSRVALDRVILPALERHAKKAAPVPTLSRVP